MAVCNHCGAQVPDGTKFCTECGQKIEAPVPVTPPAPPAQPAYTPPAPPASTPPAQPAAPAYTPPAQPAAPAYTPPAPVPPAAPAAPAQPAYTPPAQPAQPAYTAPAQPAQPAYTAPPTPPTPPTRPGPAAPASQQPTPGNKKLPLLIGCIAGGVVVLVLVIVLIVSLLGKGGDKPATGTAQSGTTGATAPAALTEMQKQWNGTWYGCLYIDDRYDCYAVVDLDAQNKGQFTIFVDGADMAFAKGSCSASEIGLSITDGTAAGGMSLAGASWMILPMPDSADQFVLGGTLDDAGEEVIFSMYIKPWGSSWKSEAEAGFTLMPPSLEAYDESVARGELPPIGFAPAGYTGTAAPGEGAAPEESSLEKLPESGSSTTSTAPAALHEGEPSSTGDGMLASMDDLYKLTKFLWDMDDAYKATYCTYDFVVDFCGVEGLDDGNHGPNSMTDLGDHYFFWKYDDTNYIFAGFRPDASGKWILTNMNTSGFSMGDIPAGITVKYPTATELGGEKSEFAGSGSQELECFMTDILTTVGWTLPDAGWVYKNTSDEICLYNVPSLDKQSSGSPIINIDCQSTLDRINFYYDSFENVQEIEGRTIAGVALKGRTYSRIGMDWTEYYGELPNGAWLRIRISKIDLSAGGEGDEILNSLTIS